jgi:hypothetical protein
MTSDRPFRGLFGHGQQGTLGHSLDVNATILGAYDSDLVADAGIVTPGAPRVDGYYTMLQTGGSYKWASSALELGITGASAFRSYGSLGDTHGVSHSAGVGLSSQIARHTKVALNQSVAYSPAYLYALFPNVADVPLGDAPPTAPNYDVDQTSSLALGTSGSLTQSVGQRTTVAGQVDYNDTDFTNSSGRRSMTTYGGRAEWSRRMRRHASMTAEYHYRRADFGVALSRMGTDQGIQVGFENTRVLSATRKARYSFGLGVSQADVPPVLAASTREAEKLYRFAADAAFAYEFSRTGEVRGSYHRGVEYLAELTQPVFVDSVSAAISGSLTRRWNVAVSGGYSSGASAVNTSSTFDTYTGDVRTQFALTSVMGIYVESLYYLYDFRGTLLLAPTLPRRLERAGVRAGLTFSTPVIKR